MEPPTLVIPFPFEPGQEYDEYERFDFWDAPNTIQWFKARGYTLYQRIESQYGPSTTSRPTYDFEGNKVQADFLYAYHDSETRTGDSKVIEAPLRGWESSGKIVFAQDSLKRYVAIKLVRDDTDEYRILRYLSQQSPSTLKENCIIIVLDFLPIEGFWFVVMPRWGSSFYEPMPNYLFEVVDIMHSCLKGLAYLHEHNIVHGDVREDNILVNHFSDMWAQYLWRQDLRRSRALSYALFDFDFSIMLPPDTNRDQFRLPYQRSWGNFNLSHDTSAGEYEYSPFALDVGALGVLFCEWHQHLAGELPLLAPLLDMMTTWEVDRRFTASQALLFFEERLAEVPEQQLQIIIPTDIPDNVWETCNRWADVPADFAEKWKAFRTPPLPWHLRALRALFRHSKKVDVHIIPKTRRFFARLVSHLYTFYKAIFPSKIPI